MDNKNQQDGYQVTRSQDIQGNAGNNYQPGQEIQLHHGQEFGQYQHHGQEFGQYQHHGQEFGQSQNHGQEFGQSQNHGQEFRQSQHHGQEFNQSQYHGGQPQYHGQGFGQYQQQPRQEFSSLPASQKQVDHSIQPELRGLTGITSCEQLCKMSCCFQGRPTWKFWIFLAYFLAIAASIGAVIFGIIVAMNTDYYYYGPYDSPSSSYRPTYYRPTYYRPTPTYGRTGTPTYPGTGTYPVAVSASSAIPSISSILGLVIMDVFIFIVFM